MSIKWLKRISIFLCSVQVSDFNQKKEREMGGMEKNLLSNYSANYSKITGMGGFPLILTLELFG
jgi:hypothetical protein